MEKNPLNQGTVIINSTETGPVTREAVHTRAQELAVLAGCTAPHVRQTDYEQAKREVTGESDSDRQSDLLDSIPETKRWDPIPGSAGRQAPESPAEDEDQEERSEAEQLVDDGAVAAEQDRIFQAAKAVKTAPREPGEVARGSVQPEPGGAHGGS
jgi:hypothetical protein